MFKTFVSTALLSIMMAAAPAYASDMGEIKSVLKLGQDGAWDQENDGRFYVMKNDSKKDAIKYYYLDSKESQIGSRRIHVDIEFRKSGAVTHGGIIFGFNKETKTYYLFTLSPEGNITLMQKSLEGAKILFKGEGKDIKEGRNTLSYVERGKHIHLAVNGKSGVGSDTFDLGDGGVGIAAWGTGEFAFTKFRKYAAIPKNSDLSSLLRPDGKSTYDAKSECALPEFGESISDMTVAGQIPRILDLPPQKVLVGLDLMSEGKGESGAANFSARQLANLPDDGIQAEHICSGIETQRVTIPEMGNRAGTIGQRLLPTADLAKAYPKFGDQIEKNGRVVQTKLKRFAAFKEFENDEAVLRQTLSAHPKINAESSFWTMPGWILVPLK